MSKQTAHKNYYLQWMFFNGLSLLPLRVLYFLSDFIYVLLFYVVGYRRKVVQENLKNSFPEKSDTERAAIEKQFYRSLCDIIVETLKLAYISEADLRNRVKYRDKDLMQSLIDQKTPFIALSSHMGNWEWSVPGACVNFNFPINGVYKPLKSNFFEAFMLRLRTRFGARLIPMKDLLRDFIRMKDTPRIIAMLSDQTPPKSEIQYWTTFLNQDTGFYVGVDKLTASFNYPVLFFKMSRVKRGYYELSAEMLHDGSKPIEKGSHEITEAFARHLEKSIQEEPHNYLWSHKRWKHKKPH